MTAFIDRSRLGKAMRATAQDPEAARLMGINVDTTIAATFLLGGMLAGAAGLIYALYQTTIWFFQGFTAGLIAFTAAVMGGIGNISGAVLGGFIIGIIQQMIRQPDRDLSGPPAPFVLRVPRADHGVQAVRPAGRGDEGGRMSTAAQPRDRRGEPDAPAPAASSAAAAGRTWAVAAALIAARRAAAVLLRRRRHVHERPASSAPPTW